MMTARKSQMSEAKMKLVKESLLNFPFADDDGFFKIREGIRNA